MKIPALKGHIGTWDYYVATLTFDQVNKYVAKIDDQLHKSDALKSLIQRSITDNYKSISEYVLNQPEFFFNALVLAVYDDYPNWIEIDFKYQNQESFQMGLLDFPGMHKIFPVDGQHRVEGIKEALKENPALGNQKITAIFIGHKNTESGMRQTRRLFSTLNRYAKPVDKNDIIALDEDDVVAIVTRELLEEFKLFTNKRVNYTKQKGIPSSNKEAITSIITLYQANIELYKSFYLETYGIKLTKQEFERQLKFRPKEEEYKAFKKYCTGFWTSFASLPDLKTFLKRSQEPAAEFRSEDGGNLIFRPVGFLPLVKASLRIHTVTKKDFKQIFADVAKINLILDSKPWQHVLWNPLSNTMLMSTATLTELMLVYLIDEAALTSSELNKLRILYAAGLSIEDKKKVKTILNGVK